MGLPAFSAFIIGIFLLPFFGHSGEASSVAVHELNCKTDYDCSSGEFCLQSGRVPYCSTCEDCQHYNRESKGCARSRRDCGKCLPGFIELGAHCSPGVKEHVMGYRDKQESKIHHGTHENPHVLLLVCGLSVLIVAVAVILPCEHGAGAAETREQANSQNLLARQRTNQFDPSATVLREPLWDATASSILQTDPVTSAPKSQSLANSTEGDDDEQAAPLSAIATYGADNDSNNGVEFALYGPASPSNPLASSIWDALQRGSERSHTGDPDEVINALSENSLEFSAIDANGGDDDAMVPQEHLPVNFQQMQRQMDEHSFYISQLE